MAEGGSFPEDFQAEQSPPEESPPEDDKFASVPKSQLKEVNIVFVGKSGAGKSVLRNNILDIKGRVEISSGHITDHYSTKQVEKNGVIISITDTIGLQGGKAKCITILKKLAKYMKGRGNADLLVYCIPVDPSSKFDDAQPAIMESLNKAFGKDIWRHCIVVFTLSNLVLDRIRKRSDTNEGSDDYYKAHIKEYATKFEHQLKKLRVRNPSVKTVFDIALEAPQPANLNVVTMISIPAGDDPKDQVLPGVQYEPLKVTLDQDTREFAISTWCDALFFEMVNKCDDEVKKTLLQYRYGLSKVRIGAIVGGIIGIVAGPVGIGVGAVLGAGIGAGVGSLVKVKKKINRAK